MSVARVHHPAEIHCSHSSLITLNHSSLQDQFHSTWNYIDVTPRSPRHSIEAAFPTIEELRDELNCCFTCGVSWADSHVSLDCSECDGYAMERPCLKCNGSCGTVWRRDLSGSHSTGKSHWFGDCKNMQATIIEESASTSISQDLSNKLEDLSTTL